MARAASAVVLPEPGGPVTRVTPSGASTALPTAGASAIPVSAGKDALAFVRPLAARAGVRAVRTRRILTDLEMLETAAGQQVRPGEERFDGRFDILGRARSAHDAAALAAFHDGDPGVIGHVEREHPDGIARIAQRDQREPAYLVPAHAAHGAVQRQLGFFAAAHRRDIFARVLLDAPRLIIVDGDRAAAGRAVDAVNEADKFVSTHRPTLQRFDRLDVHRMILRFGAQPTRIMRRDRAGAQAADLKLQP